MARPRTTFKDAELRGILDAAREADTRYPDHNVGFLDHFITGVAQATGRLFGQPIYVRLLNTAGISRRPSAPTWSAAIARARSVALPSPARQAVATSSARPVQRPVEHETLAYARAPDRDDETAEWKVRTQVAEAALADAYRQIRRLETLRDDALRLLAVADARASAGERQVIELTNAKDTIAATLTARIDALQAAEGRLAGLERHLRLQTDQMRTELSQEVAHYKSRLETAEKALARERSQTDVMRRMIGDRASAATGQTDPEHPAG